MKTLGILILLILTSVMVAHAVDTSPEVVTLTKDNHVSLVGGINNESVDEAILKLNANKNNSVLLFIDSPGGEVAAGIKLLDYLYTTEKKIICVARMAISMAHQIMQSCHIRLATPQNIMMQHRMSAGVTGPVNSMTGLLAVFVGLEVALSEISARRIGVSMDYFMQKITQEWWTFGKESKDLNMVDDLVRVSCNPELYATSTKKTVSYLGQPIPLIINGCPLISIKIDDSDRKLDNQFKENFLRQFTYFSHR